MSGSSKYIFDADPSVLLRSDKDPAETGAITNSETPISLENLDTADFHDGDELAHKKFDIAVFVKSVSVTGSVTLNLQIDNSESFSSPVTIRSITVTDPGYHSIPVLGDDLKDLKSDASHLRIQYVGTDAADSIEYGAWISRPALA